MMSRYRLLAYDWHNGQWSPLYAFASSGIVEDLAALQAEIAENLRTADPFCTAELRELRDYVDTLPYNALTGRYEAPWSTKPCITL